MAEDQPDKLALLRRIWTAPGSFKPRQTSRDITEAAAQSFAALAENLRQRGATDGETAAARQQRANQVAHFLTQCLFCFFAEDVGLLPGRMFERLVAHKQITPERLTQGLTQLFTTMQTGGLYGVDDIPWFNGGLFQAIAVPALSAPDLHELRRAADLDWSAIDVSIFGTLFERGLDPAKRSQLGAHYTDPATIERLIDPVIRRPLLQKWELLALDLQAISAKITKKGDKHYRAAHALFVTWLDELKNYRALDPACGSGNFLFLALKCLKDVEHHSHLQAAELGLDREADLVTGPHNVLGIELNEYAAELARVTVWIGELQWRLAHGYEFKTNPVLDTLEHIECRDALLDWNPAQVSAPAQGAAQAWGSDPDFAQQNSGTDPLSGPQGAAAAPQQASGSTQGTAQAWGSDHDFAQRNSCSDPHPGPPGAATAPQEAPWPPANVVIGNPPFLGGSKKRGELGARYVEALDAVYAPSVPGAADLVCYWFEKARAQIAAGHLQRAGLVTTNSIRGGANRKVLDAIYAQTRIFEAWSDEPWINNGAAVRVSLVAFGHDETTTLNGISVKKIYSDLTGADDDVTALDLSTAQKLTANSGAVFEGLRKDGPLDIPGEVARKWLQLPNPHGKSNAQVLFPLINGMDVTRRPRDSWVIDTGESMTEQDASLFEAPFEHITTVVKPIRLENNDRIRRSFWWRFGRNGEKLRSALTSLPRFINTPRVAKHRLFVWQSVPSIPDTATVAIARSDDTTFGILHSRFHELWSLRMCTWLGVGNDPRYTPTTCFETFPFPAGLTPADTAHQRTEAVDGGALIPADLPDTLAEGDSKPNKPLAPVHQAQEAIKIIPTRQAATAIAQAAQRLNALRQAWLNPPEWTERVPEVVPLGMSASPYPDRIVPKPGFEKELAQRTLTNLYNQRPAWLAAAHAQLDAAVAAAYGWADFTADMEDNEILRRLLALNLQRSTPTGA
ncbi:MAG: DNA methyltransferase [Giesbergeria sp.]